VSGLPHEAKGNALAAAIEFTPLHALNAKNVAAPRVLGYRIKPVIVCAHDNIACLYVDHAPLAAAKKLATMAVRQMHAATVENMI
jgi:hypothetical protein